MSFLVIFGSKIAAKSVNLPLFTSVTIGNGGSRRSACSGVRHRANASRLVESYEFISQALKIDIRNSYENLSKS